MKKLANRNLSAQAGSKSKPKNQKTAAKIAGASRSSIAISPSTMTDEGAAYAKEMGLRYVRDVEPGIQRRRKGKGFSYIFGGKKVTSDKVLDRIQALVIPPAWEDVWICQHQSGHLQATGRDARDRKQYRYHADWSKARNETKFEKLIAFGHSLSLIRQRVQHDLRQKEMSRNKILAAVIQIMEDTRIRIGNDIYATENESYGLTTIHNDHVKVRGDQIKFHFKGKSGVQHESTLSDARLGKIIKHCQDLPGEELFAYRDEDGVVHDIGSSDVNAYLNEITGEHITAKDFRTWGGTLKAAEILLQLGPTEELSERKYKKRMGQIIEASSQHLGNTVAVCRKYYVHPGIFDVDKDGTLHASYKKIQQTNSKNILKPEELLLLESLQKIHKQEN